MTKFENELKKGNFVVSNCIKCNQIVWPPSEICNKCFSAVKWKEISMDGILLEFSKKDDMFFGIGKFAENIRIMGKLKNNVKEPKIGNKIKLTNFEIHGNEQHFMMELL